MTLQEKIDSIRWYENGEVGVQDVMNRPLMDFLKLLHDNDIENNNDMLELVKTSSTAIIQGQKDSMVNKFQRAKDRIELDEIKDNIEENKESYIKSKKGITDINGELDNIDRSILSIVKKSKETDDDLEKNNNLSISNAIALIQSQKDSIQSKWKDIEDSEKIEETIKIQKELKEIMEKHGNTLDEFTHLVKKLTLAVLQEQRISMKYRFEI